jgi:DNA topoisomerase-3
MLNISSQGKYGDLDSSLVSYGPCQTPTLSFCVERMDKINSFKPEPFWYLDVELQHASSGQSFFVKWSRVHLFDKEIVYMFYNDIKQAANAQVLSVVYQEKTKQRPTALNTVELLRACSAGLGISPIQAMHVAERLYTRGYISYPRTETTTYPANFDLRSVLQQQAKSSSWGGLVKSLLDGDMQHPRKGTDHGDHPPITPTSYASQEELSGDEWRIYEFVTKYYIATVSPDCRYEELTVTVKIENEEFSATGKSLTTKGWTELMPWKQVDSKDIPKLKKGELLQIGQVKICLN